MIKKSENMNLNSILIKGQPILILPLYKPDRSLGWQHLLQPEHINTSSPLIVAGGFSYGLLTALISAVGPLNVVMLEKTGHYRENLIGNFAAIGFSLSIARTPFYFIADIFPYDLLILFLLGFPIIFLGTKAGQRLTPRIPIKKFQVLVFCFLIIIGLKSIITSVLGILLLV